MKLWHIQMTCSVCFGNAAHSTETTMRIPLGTTVTLIGLGLAGSAQAHGPSRQKVIANITIQAPAEVVWQRI